MNETATPRNNGEESEPLPFVAPCKKLEVSAPIRWIKLGWQDLRQAPKVSLSYGAILVVISYLLAFLAINLGNFVVLLALLSGFIFLGPLLAMTFYDISSQLQKDRTPSLAHSVGVSLRQIGNQMVFAMILMVIFLVWARAASMIHVFFPAEAHPSLTELALFLTIGSTVGSLFSVFVFCISAFSLPMIMDRDADTVTTVVTSVNAVLRNKKAMAVWVLLIVAAVAIGVVTGFIGLAVTLPLIGHATWHAYQETIDSSAWPRHSA